jgi:hypothetical protein
MLHFTHSNVEFVMPSSEFLDRQMAKEIDEVPSVSLKELDRQPISLLSGGKDQHVDVTVPERHWEDLAATRLFARLVTGR